MKMVRTVSRTIRVVADISFVTVTPAKLKNAMLQVIYRINGLAELKLSSFFLQTNYSFISSDAPAACTHTIQGS